MDNELYHHGIKGQKWGIRRFQNKDGSLTKAGKKRLGYSTDNKRGKSLFKKNKKTATNKTDVDKNTSPKKKISEMSDAELKEYINRKQTERQAYEINKQLASYTQKKDSVGKTLASKFISEALIPAAVAAGKSYLEKSFKDKLGLNEKDTLSKLKEKYDILDYKKKIENMLKEPDKRDKELEDLKKEYSLLDQKNKNRLLKDTEYQNASRDKNYYEMKLAIDKAQHPEKYPTGKGGNKGLSNEEIAALRRILEEEQEND